MLNLISIILLTTCVFLSPFSHPSYVIVNISFNSFLPTTYRVRTLVRNNNILSTDVYETQVELFYKNLFTSRNVKFGHLHLDIPLPPSPILLEGKGSSTYVTNIVSLTDLTLPVFLSFAIDAIKNWGEVVVHSNAASHIKQVRSKGTVGSICESSVNIWRWPPRINSRVCVVTGMSLGWADVNTRMEAGGRRIKEGGRSRLDLTRSSDLEVMMLS